MSIANRKASKTIGVRSKSLNGHANTTSAVLWHIYKNSSRIILQVSISRRQKLFCLLNTHYSNYQVPPIFPASTMFNSNMTHLKEHKFMVWKHLVLEVENSIIFIDTYIKWSKGFLLQSASGSLCIKDTIISYHVMLEEQALHAI